MQEKEEKNRAPKYSQGREAEEYEKGCEINKKSAIKRDTTPPPPHTQIFFQRRGKEIKEKPQIMSRNSAVTFVLKP